MRRCRPCSLCIGSETRRTRMMSQPRRPRRLLTLLFVVCAVFLALDGGATRLRAVRSGAIRGRVDLRRVPTPAQPRPNVADLGGAASALAISDPLRSVVYL